MALPDHYEALEPDVRELVDKYVRLTKERPRDGKRHGELGLVYEANELWTEAKRAFATAIELTGPDPLLRLHLAINTEQSGDPKAARQILAAVVADAPDLAAAQYRYGQLLLEADEVAAAEKALEAAARLAPNAAEPLAALADVRLRQRQVDQAVKLLEKSIQLDPQYRVAHFLLGTAYRQQQRLDEAQRELQLGDRSEVHYVIDELSERGEQFAVNARARHARGVRLMTEGKHQQAMISLVAAHRAAPKDVVIANALAGSYMQAGRTDDAFQLLTGALNADDRHGTTYINLASWYLFKGKPADALKYAHGAVERSPTIPMAHVVRIETLMALKQYQEALAATDQALGLLPGDATIQGYSTRLKALGVTR